MRSILLIPLLLTACSTGSLYPNQIDMVRTCPEVVSDSYKSLSRYNKKATLSTLTMAAVLGASCVASAGLSCILSGPLYYVVDDSLGPYGKKSAANEFNKDMRQGRDMKCTETWK